MSRQMQYRVHAPSAARPVRRGQRLTVQPWETALIFRDGAVEREASGATVKVRGRNASARVLDLRPRLLQLPTQEVPTAEGVTVKVTVTAQVSISDARTYVTASQTPDELTYLAVQVALRELIAGMVLDAIVAARTDLPSQLAAAVHGVDELGVRIDRIEVKDIVLPAELRRAQAQVLLARAEGQAALERARGESAALRSLVNAARLTAENPTLYQLRLLQQLASSSGHTVVIDTQGRVPASD